MTSALKLEDARDLARFCNGGDFRDIPFNDGFNIGYVNAFLPVHNLASLMQLGEVLRAMGQGAGGMSRRAVA